MYNITEKNFKAFQVSFWASMGTFLGGVIVVCVVKLFGADPNSKKTSQLMGILQSVSAGVMVFMTCFHLIPESVDDLGQTETMIYFFAGVCLFGILERFIIPHEHEHEPKKVSKEKRKQKDKAELLRTSMVTFIALALHNIPEGISVYLATLGNSKIGHELAVAVMLHNIPEGIFSFKKGMAVAIPLFASTGSISKVLTLTLLNGLAEPAGVVLGGVLLAPYLNNYLISRCLALVSGIMFCISIHELFPVSIKYCGRNLASISFFVGMALCSFALEIVEVYMSNGEPAEGLSCKPHHSGHSHGHNH